MADGGEAHARNKTEAGFEDGRRLSEPSPVEPSASVRALARGVVA